MTEETYAKYKALLEDGAISQAEFDMVTADNMPDETEASAAPDAPQNASENLRTMYGNCTSVMAASILMLILSFVFIPRKPEFGEYDIGNAFLYMFGIGFWFLRAIAGCILTYSLASRACRLFRQAETGTDCETDYRHAKRTLLWAVVLLAVFTLHQILRFIYPAGTPHNI